MKYLAVLLTIILLAALLSLAGCKKETEAEKTLITPGGKIKSVTTLSQDEAAKAEETRKREEELLKRPAVPNTDTTDPSKQQVRKVPGSAMPTPVEGGRPTNAPPPSGP